MALRSRKLLLTYLDLLNSLGQALPRDEIEDFILRGKAPDAISLQPHFFSCEKKWFGLFPLRSPLLRE
jgi:hypothetical protein